MLNIVVGVVGAFDYFYCLAIVLKLASVKTIGRYGCYTIIIDSIKSK